MTINFEFLPNIIYPQFNFEYKHKFNVLIDKVLYIFSAFIQFFHICMKLLENNAVFYDICLDITVYSVDLYLRVNSYIYLYSRIGGK